MLAFLKSGRVYVHQQQLPVARLSPTAPRSMASRQPLCRATVPQESAKQAQIGAYSGDAASNADDLQHDSCLSPQHACSEQEHSRGAVLELGVDCTLPPLLQGGHHGREVLCGVLLSSDEGQNSPPAVLVTGSEDGTIRRMLCSSQRASCGLYDSALVGEQPDGAAVRALDAVLLCSGADSAGGSGLNNEAASRWRIVGVMARRCIGCHWTAPARRHIEGSLT